MTDGWDRHRAGRHRPWLGILRMCGPGHPQATRAGTGAGKGHVHQLWVVFHLLIHFAPAFMMDLGNPCSLPHWPEVSRPRMNGEHPRPAFGRKLESGAGAGHGTLVLPCGKWLSYCQAKDWFQKLSVLPIIPLLLLFQLCLPSLVSLSIYPAAKESLQQVHDPVPWHVSIAVPMCQKLPVQVSGPWN